MNNRTLLDEFISLASDERRYLYANALDLKTLGRLNQVSKKFNFFGGDVEMWKMRIRREVPGIFMPMLATLGECVGFYRIITGMKELHAFSLQWLINSFFNENFDEQDIALVKIQRELIDGSWRPLTEKQLDDLAASLHADPYKYEIVKGTAHILLDAFATLTSNNQTLNEVPSEASMNEKAKLVDGNEPENYIEAVSGLFSTGAHRVQFTYSHIPPEVLADKDNFIHITRQIALGSMLHYAAGFLFARNQVPLLLTILHVFYKNCPQLFEVIIHTGDGKVNLGEQLFLMSLGAEDLSNSRQIFWLPCTPVPEITAWMIEKNAVCVRSSSVDKLYGGQDVTFDSDRLYYSPLYLAIEAITKIQLREITPEAAIRDLDKLRTIVVSLLEHGEKMDQVAKFIDDVKHTPASLLASTLYSLAKDNLTPVESAMCETLTFIQGLIKQQKSSLRV